MPELLLELLCEEIPARMQRAALAELTTLLRDRLAAAGTAAERIEGYVTPRRLTIVAAGLPARQPDRREERRGPRVGVPPAALAGFVRAAGLASLEDCEIRDTGRGAFYFAIIDQPGAATATILPEIVLGAIRALSWPKSMRFPGALLRWVRPINSVLCLYDGVVVPLDLGQVPVGNTTRGHRFLAPDEIAIKNAADYRERLEKAFVVLDPERRKGMIRKDLDQLAAEAGVTVRDDPPLLDEVTGLVEYPVTLPGAIDPAFMSLPPEVLTAAMRTHQKYFSCLNPDGSAAPLFFFVANNRAPDGGKAIVSGNERVLRARLADARFFWDQDRKTRLEDRVKALKGRVYHENLGSVYDKVQRMAELAGALAPLVPGADRICARRAALLAKADLSTAMVGEFPELQGIIGNYYYLEEHNLPKSDRISAAIREHYKPLGPNDTCPTLPESIVVALADKTDTLVSFFAIDQKPTGSRDPFALRRSALGLVRIILENKLHLKLDAAFHTINNTLVNQRHSFYRSLEARLALVNEIRTFVLDRMRVYLRESGVRHDLITAVFSQSVALAIGALAVDDLVSISERIDALGAFLATDDGSNLLTAYRRAISIVSIEERKSGYIYNIDVDQNYFVQPEEEALFRSLNNVVERMRTVVPRGAFTEAMAELATLRHPVDEFFDRVTVNADEPELRENRLRLLSAIRATMNQVADFSQIEG